MNLNNDYYFGLYVFKTKYTDLIGISEFLKLKFIFDAVLVTHVQWCLFVTGYFGIILRTSWPGRVWCNRVVVTDQKEFSRVECIGSLCGDVAVVNHLLFMNRL